jgi:hypothetical protein
MGRPITPVTFLRNCIQCKSVQFDIFIAILGAGAYIVIIDFLLNPTAHFMSENTKHTILDHAGQLTVLLIGLCTKCHTVSRLNELLWTDDLSCERHYTAVTEATEPCLLTGSNGCGRGGKGVLEEALSSEVG